MRSHGRARGKERNSASGPPSARAGCSRAGHRAGPRSRPAPAPRSLGHGRAVRVSPFSPFSPFSRLSPVSLCSLYSPVSAGSACGARRFPSPAGGAGRGRARPLALKATPSPAHGPMCRGHAPLKRQWRGGRGQGSAQSPRSPRRALALPRPLRVPRSPESRARPRRSRVAAPCRRLCLCSQRYALLGPPGTAQFVISNYYQLASTLPLDTVPGGSQPLRCHRCPLSLCVQAKADKPVRPRRTKPLPHLPDTHLQTVASIKFYSSYFLNKMTRSNLAHQVFGSP